MFQILTIILAGGVGERLLPLTQDHAKPAVPFGGVYRLIDIPLSNCINSGLRKIYVLTQHKALSLNRHIRQAWNILCPELGQFIEVLSPTKRVRESWYLGTADSVFQNRQSILEEGCPYVLVLSSDHVYKMDYLSMLEWHRAHEADVTVATTQVPPVESRRFGIVCMDAHYVIHEFKEKPQEDPSDRSPFNPYACSASMGIYLFNTEVMLAALQENAEIESSDHDFGKDILPRLVKKQRVVAYDFVDENKKEVLYWRDVGTLESYYEANMDLVAVDPVFNLYDQQWPIRTAMPQLPPAKFVFAESSQRMGIALDSIVSPGCVLAGGMCQNSVLSAGVRIQSCSKVEKAILFPNVTIGAHCRIRRAILGENLEIADGTEIGFNLAQDQTRGYTVTSTGIVVAPSRDIKDSRTEMSGFSGKAAAAGITR
jgi:glucose-1-phosphate adenylyltransferase